MLKCGDLVVMDQEQFGKSCRSFDKRWRMVPRQLMATMTYWQPTSSEVWATARRIYELGRARDIAAFNKKTRREYDLKYRGDDFAPLSKNRIIGIVMEIIPEVHGDLDVIKLLDQGNIHYCRRFILEAS